VRLKITYSDDPLRPVLPYWIDTDTCDVDPTFDVPGGKGRGSTYTDRHHFRVPGGAGGRIITAGGHLHGGGKFVDLRSRTCDRTLVNSRAYYGQPGHSFYRVRPTLHEPSPIRMGIHNSAEGIPISSGEDLELVAGYDNEIPHTRVMSIMALYVAQEAVPQCAPMPGDVQETNRPGDFRKPYPRFKVPLIRKPDDPFRRASRGNNVGTYFFRPDRITARRGQKVTWTFRGGVLHTVSVANGPRGFSSPWIGDGKYSYTPRKRGRYRLFCALHPAAMTQELRVK
jgi:plastocyanin